MKRDQYGVVANSQPTYVQIAKLLYENGSLLISWTDGLGSQLDILFNLLYYSPIGPIQGGLQSTYLYVSVMRVGAFGFKIEDSQTTADYYAEKLGITGKTSEKIAELLNGVRKELSKK